MKLEWPDLSRDTDALLTRLAVNERFGAQDLNQFVLQLLDSKRGERIFDLGCGTGKLLLTIADRVGPSGLALGLDISRQSLLIASREAARKGVELQLICARMEDFGSLLRAVKLDAILSVYALYYSRVPEETLAVLEQSLAPGGRLLVVGPYRGNNAELLAIQEKVAGLSETQRRSQFFFDDVVIPTCRRLFRELSAYPFENEVTFPSPESVVDYWRSGGYYVAEALPRFQEAISHHFSTQSQFVLHKRALALLAR